MAFNIEEARAIIEDAKKRGLIADQNSRPAPAIGVNSKPAAKAPPKTTGNSTVIPDWLQKGITDAAAGEPPISNDHLFSSRE